MKNLVIAGLVAMGMVGSSFAANVKWLLVVIPTVSSPTADYQSKLYDTEKALDDDATVLANTVYRNRQAIYSKVSVDLDTKKEQFEYQLQKVAK